MTWQSIDMSWPCYGDVFWSIYFKPRLKSHYSTWQVNLLSPHPPPLYPVPQRTDQQLTEICLPSPRFIAAQNSMCVFLVGLQTLISTERCHSIMSWDGRQSFGLGYVLAVNIEQFTKYRSYHVVPYSTVPTHRHFFVSELNSIFFGILQSHTHTQSYTYIPV